MFKLTLFLLLTLFACSNFSQENPPCGNWTAYKDEKCFKLFDHLATLSDALKYCNENDESTLAIIKTKDEQDAIIEIIKSSDVADNIWIGITRKDQNFINSDQTELEFKNWAENRPLKNKTGLDCFELSTDDANYGKWFYEKCQKQNAVICQKIQPWSVTRLQTMLIDLKREFEKVNDEHEGRIAHLEQNPVPIGFIYAQFMGQNDPKTLWPNTEWENISPKLAGLFFRVEGSQSSSFGQIQEQQTQSLQVLVQHGKFGEDVWESVATIGTDFTDLFSGVDDGIHPRIHHFFRHTSEEIRPRNTAIRVWQRIK